MAITKVRKDELVNQYVHWLNNSQASILTEYSGLTMKQIDDLRAKAREVGGEFHIVKNTLGRVAIKTAGMQLKDETMEGSTAIAFAFRDAPALAKVISEFARTSDFVNIKGGYLEKRLIGPEDVKALADLPPLPVMRARLLATILAPLTQMARTLSEPGRQMAAVLQAYAEKEGAPAVDTAA